MGNVLFAEQNSLKLELKPPHFKRNYGVAYAFKSGKKEDTVKFDAEVTYVKTLIGQSRIFKIDRTSEVFVNNILPDLIADKLAYACGKCFYPLLLEVDFDGNYIGVYNYAEIFSRWQGHKISVGEYFKGEDVERYLRLMDQAISAPELVDDIFRNDLFCNVFFSAFYKSYSGEFKLKQEMTFPLAGRSAGVVFITDQEVNPLLNEAGHIEINHTGNPIDQRSALDLLEEQSFPIEELNDPSVKPITGSYAGRYILEAETKSIRSVFARWMLDYEEPLETEIKIFEKLEEDNIIIVEQEENNGMFFIDGGSAAPKEKKITDLFSFLWQK